MTVKENGRGDVFPDVSFPPLRMATIVEREIHHAHDAGSESSATAMIVTVVALIAIVGFALFFFRMLPFAGTADTGNGGSINIDADLPAPTGTPTPDSTNF